MKVCNRCLKEKELDEFFKDKKHSTGRYSICKPCKKISTYEWREKNKDVYNASMRAYNKKHRKRIHYKRAYGITIEEYQRMLAAQKNACWICEKQNTKFVIDHSHTTGKIRGILCYGCNRALSLLERPYLLQKAMEYLLRN